MDVLSVSPCLCRGGCPLPCLSNPGWTPLRRSSTLNPGPSDKGRTHESRSQRDPDLSRDPLTSAEDVVSKRTRSSRTSRGRRGPPLVSLPVRPWSDPLPRQWSSGTRGRVGTRGTPGRSDLRVKRVFGWRDGGRSPSGAGRRRRTSGGTGMRGETGERRGVQVPQNTCADGRKVVTTGRQRDWLRLPGRVDPGQCQQEGPGTDGYRERCHPYVVETQLTDSNGDVTHTGHSPPTTRCGVTVGTGRVPHPGRPGVRHGQSPDLWTCPGTGSQLTLSFTGARSSPSCSEVGGSEVEGPTRKDIPGVSPTVPREGSPCPQTPVGLPSVTDRRSGDLWGPAGSTPQTGVGCR